MRNHWLRWLLYLAGGVIALVGIVYCIGLTRPELVQAKASIDIAKPVPYVFDLVADPRKQKDWFAGIDSIEILSESPLRYRMNAGGHAGEIEVTRLEPQRRVATKTLTHTMGMGGEWDTRFEAIPAGTRIHHEARLHFSNPLLRVMALVMDANQEELSTLVALKKYAESH